METFNLFRNLTFSEAGHNSLLKKLLHKNGKHNQGDMFIKSFVTNVLKCDYSGFLNVEIEVKSGERGFVDILLQDDNKKTIYIIENKIRGANDRPNQLYRYWRNHIKAAEEKGLKGDYKIFYLTSNGSNPTLQSLSKPIVSARTTKYNGLPDILPIDVGVISYKKDIKKWLKDCLEKIEKTDDNLRLIVALEQYIEWIEKEMTK
ncbi:PD-(D/E)XK nuclease family protein [uncultured Sunxiuqinia sp.]|uniref:PDDEXK-like family protein n=1 Tax=uncultured Sunxiuqinia sp. TaxID=1573825 RepID=UPI002609399D|nr:PD-(D/E)XK nuclease family protein [uncultured Sunxiuqinia sp.]